MKIKNIAIGYVLTFLSACAQPTSEADLAIHYKTESYLRDINTIQDKSVFYIIPVDGGGPPAGIKINGAKLDMHIFQNGFYAFCLSQGKYDIEYIAPVLSKNTIEMITVDGHETIYRGINTNVMWGNMSVRSLEKDEATKLLSSKRMLPPPIPYGLPATRTEVGIYADYMAFPYRCRL